MMIKRILFLMLCLSNHTRSQLKIIEQISQPINIGRNNKVEQHARANIKKICFSEALL